MRFGGVKWSNHDRLTQASRFSPRGMADLSESWIYEGPAADRLWQKSAIGRPVGEGKLELSPAETMFVHYHRHLDLPTNDWKYTALNQNSMLLQEYSILEALRVPGNKLILSQNIELFSQQIHPMSWAARWTSNTHPRNSKPVSEIRWFHESDKLDAVELHQWIIDVSSSGRIPEVLVVDEELSVVTYHLSSENPLGSFQEHGAIESLANLSGGITSANGLLFPSDDWNIKQLGVPTSGGIHLDSIACEIIQGLNPISEGAMILSDLLNRGLFIRPGFKYGTRWRCYDKPLGEDHAPFLVVLPEDAPRDWAGACLASRLASGVNKIWLHPVGEGNSWNYLAITRPPPDSRWSNPNKR